MTTAGVGTAVGPPPGHRGADRGRWPVRGLLASTGLSVAGNEMVLVLVPWLVLSLTGRPALAGLVAAAALLAAVPALFLGGALLDRRSRRRLSVGADLLGAAAVLALPLLGATVGLTVGTVAVLVAAGAAFDGPGHAAREALRPDVAALARLPRERVNASGEVAEQVGAMAGPVLAGAGLAVVGTSGALGVAALLLLASAATTALCLPRDAPAPRPAEPYLTAARAGLRLVWRDPVLRALGLAGTLAVFFLEPLVLVLTTHLQRSGRPAALGLVLAAFAVGGIAGAVGYGAVAPRLRRRTVLLCCLATASGGLLAMAALPPPWALAGLAGVVGVAFGPVNPVVAVVVQDRTPDRLRGRVVATLASLGLLAAPAAALGAGLLLEVTSPAVVLAVVGAGSLAVTAVVAAVPALRRLERADLQESP